MLLAFTMGVSLTVAAAQQGQTPAKPQDRQTPPAAASPSTLERWYMTLYKLVWPGGRYQGNLAEKVRPATVEQAGEVDIVPKVYQVNARTGSFEEWPTASGVVEFVVSPDGTKLFYRRERGLYVEQIAVGEKVAPSSAPQRVEGVELLRLYACTQKAGVLELWAESPQQTVRVLRLTAGGAAWSDLPPEAARASADPQELVKYLRNLRSLRSDGTRVWVRNNRLVGRKDADKRDSLIVSGRGNAPRFFGTPVWVKADSDLLFVSGNEGKGGQ